MTGSQGLGRVFISYRREDTAYPAGWLFDRLEERYGDGQIFKDVDSIELGDDFVAVLKTAVGSCEVLLALIGEQWLSITDERGSRRLENPEDFVRLEIEAALARSVRVIPILVDGATMPGVADLPPSLAKLAHRHALELSPNRFDADTNRLLEVLDDVLIPSGPAPESVPRGPAPGGEHGGVPGKGSARPSGDGRWRPPGRAPVLIGLALLAVVLVVGLLIVPGRSASVARPIFSDDFTTPGYGWRDAGDEQVGAHYRNGAYRIYVEPISEGGGELSTPSLVDELWPIAPEDVRVQVDARRTLGSETEQYHGVICRASGPNQYSFSIGEASATIAKFTGREPYYEQLRYVDSAEIDADARNRLDVRCESVEGQQAVRLTFLVNGRLVAEVTDVGDPLTGGSVGLGTGVGPAAGTPTEAEFDNFSVSLA